VQLENPAEEFLQRLKERARDRAMNPDDILDMVLNELRTKSDLQAYLKFESTLTTAPQKLNNPVGHYRTSVTQILPVSRDTTAAPI
jgi:hypothetical protein